jgi:hypothetical protein
MLNYNNININCRKKHNYRKKPEYCGKNRITPKLPLGTPLIVIDQNSKIT